MNPVNYQSGAIVPSECFSGAWHLVTRNMGMYIGIGVVTMLMISCIPLLNIILIGPVMGGFAYVVLRDMRDEPVDFGMMFKGFEKFKPLMLIGVIQSIPGIVVQILQWTIDIGRLASRDMEIGSSSTSFPGISSAFLIPVIIVGIGFMLFSLFWYAALFFCIPLLTENDMGIGEAIKLSMGAVVGNLGGLILIYIFGFLVMLLGMLVFCVGMLVSIPVVFAANVFAYRQVFPRLETFMNQEPPPPNIYGDFGRSI